MTNPTLNSETTSETKNYPIAYRANWVCPVDSPPIENGFVEVNHGIISSVGRIGDCRIPVDRIVDLGSGAIIPGLVNAHSHLEFSDLPQPLGEPGIGFTDWIRLIVKSRMDSNEQSPAKKTAAIQLGINHSVGSGVAAIGEICTAPFELEDYSSEAAISILHFLEQLGSDEAVLEKHRGQLLKHLLRPTAESAQVVSNFGASPHAPYSCHPSLVEQICQQAAANNHIVAMHLAETKQERELLESGSGDFVDLLKDFGVWNSAAFGASRSIFSTLQTLSSCQSLIIHGNYLNEKELDFIAEHHKRMTIVFCPRTHAFFQHDEYPIKRVLERGIQVAIGTDSLASNPDLDLFAELKEVARAFPHLAATQILQMGTINGASALGLGSQLGTLTPGKAATIGFVEQEMEANSNSPIETWLFAPASSCRRV